MIQIFYIVIQFSINQMNFDEDFLKYLNLAREHPAYFIPAIEKQISSFTNEKQMSISSDIIYETNQGKALWFQTKNFLMTQKPLPPLKKHNGLLKASQDHKNDLCSSGTFGHQGSDGSTFSERILKYCKKGPGAMAEIIGSDFDFPHRNTPQMTILGLIIDDGVKQRGHRKTIFSPIYRYVGWSSGRQDQKMLTVFNFTQNYLDENFKLESRSIQIKKPDDFSKSQGFETYNPLKQATNFSYDSRAQTKRGQLNPNVTKKVSQKYQDTKIYYQDSCKIIETTTRYIYRDGTVEENVQKRTLYPTQ